MRRRTRNVTPRRELPLATSTDTLATSSDGTSLDDGMDSGSEGEYIPGDHEYIPSEPEYLPSDPRHSREPRCFPGRGGARLRDSAEMQFHYLSDSEGEFDMTADMQCEEFYDLNDTLDMGTSDKATLNDSIDSAILYDSAISADSAISPDSATLNDSIDSTTFNDSIDSAIETATFSSDSACDRKSLQNTNPGGTTSYDDAATSPEQEQKNPSSTLTDSGFHERSFQETNLDLCDMYRNPEERHGSFGSGNHSGKTFCVKYPRTQSRYHGNNPHDTRSTLQGSPGSSVQEIVPRLEDLSVQERSSPDRNYFFGHSHAAWSTREAPRNPRESRDLQEVRSSLQEKVFCVCSVRALLPTTEPEQECCFW